MKKIILVLVLFWGVLNTYSASSFSKSQAWKIVKEALKDDGLDSMDVYVSDYIVKRGAKIKRVVGNIVAPDYDSWFFFVDEYPQRGWSHPCKYVFVNSVTGAIEMKSAEFPPVYDGMSVVSQFVPKSNYTVRQVRSMQPTRNSANQIVSARHDYAVIINGGMDKESNHQRYWNDCAMIYTVLKNKYMYPSDHIYVMMADGKSPEKDRRLINNSFDSSPLDLDGDGVGDIQYAATKNNLYAVFDTLRARMTSEDNLLIYTIDHGGSLMGETLLCLWGEYIYASEFAQLVNKVPAAHINVCMGQCNSGGFIPHLEGEGRVIATAASATENSYGAEQYDTFVYEWASALLGSYPNGRVANADSNGDSKVSMREAFLYASSHDFQNEHPQFSSHPITLADELNASHIYNLAIVGTPIVCDSAMYNIEGLPDDFDVVWSYGNSNSYPFPKVKQNTPIHNYCMVTNACKYPYNGTLCANVYENGVLLGTAEKPVSSSSSSFYGKYRQETCSVNWVNHPEITWTDVKLGTPMFVHQGCRVQLKSSLLKNRRISYEGVTPDLFFFNDKDMIDFTLPLGSGGIPFRIRIVGEGECFETELLFFSVAFNGSLPRTLKIAKNEKDAITIEVIDNIGNNLKQSRLLSKRESVDDYFYEIFSGLTGEKKVSGRFVGKTINVNTVGWDSGLYVVKVISPDETISSKIVIK